MTRVQFFFITTPLFSIFIFIFIIPDLELPRDYNATQMYTTLGGLMARSHLLRLIFDELRSNAVSAERMVRRINVNFSSFILLTKIFLNVHTPHSCCLFII